MTLRIVGLALIATLAVHQSALGASKWQQKLIDGGWVEVKRKLTDFTDPTWYGQRNEIRSTEGYVYYLRPNGKTGLLRTPNGKTYIDYRREGKEGRI